MVETCEEYCINGNRCKYKAKISREDGKKVCKIHGVKRGETKRTKEDPKAETKAETKRETTYGEVARTNGLLFEQVIIDYYNNNNTEKLKLLNKISEQFNIDIETIKNGELCRFQQNKVESIYGKKTTRKADIYYKSNGRQFGISVKMSNQGTQLQIISLENLKIYLRHHAIVVQNDIETLLKRFLGIGCDRLWLTDFSTEDQSKIISFFKSTKSLLLKLIYSDGLCKKEEDKASIFIFNNSYFTGTKEVVPFVLSYNDILSRSEGDTLMTKLGNIQLCKKIGVQRKGSGKSSSATCLQFKDWGYKNSFPKTEIKQPTTFRGLSLFSSSGLGETFMKPYVNIVVANELLPTRAKLYSHFYPETKMILGDITNQTVFNSIIEECKKNEVDFIYATPPCQSFSKAGKQLQNDTRSNLFLYIIQIIQAVKPKYVLIENVPEFIKSYCILPQTEAPQKIIDVITDQIEAEYNVNSEVINSCDYEVPQSRKRAIILISKKSESKWDFPLKINRMITVQDAIGNLPSLESGDKSDIHRWHYSKVHNERHILWMRHTPTGKSAFDNEVHYPSKDGRKISGYKTTYKRIAWDKPAPTITMANGSISSQNNVHPGRQLENNLYSDARVLTVYELMLLTGLPQDWNIPDWCSEKVVREVIGECVPPRMIYHLIKNIPRVE